MPLISLHYCSAIHHPGSQSFGGERSRAAAQLRRVRSHCCGPDYRGVSYICSVEFKRSLLIGMRRTSAPLLSAWLLCHKFVRWILKSTACTMSSCSFWDVFRSRFDGGHESLAEQVLRGRRKCYRSRWLDRACIRPWVILQIEIRCQMGRICTRVLRQSSCGPCPLTCHTSVS